MASADVCDPCLERNKTVHAKKYCSECEEKLCAECTESHRGFKAFKSHHVIDLSSVGARILPTSKINCEIHTDVQIDYFCSQHDVVCCRACIPDSHRSCETVIPLDFASKDVKNSSLLSDTLKELDNMTATLEKITENRDDNRKLLKEKKSLIIKQISTIKSKLLKHLDDLEERLITEVASVQEKNEEKIEREKDELSQITSVLKDNKQELEFLKNHGSNNQLFLVLRKQITIIQKTDKKIHDMTSAINEIDMEFEEIKNFNIGSVSQITRPCPIKYKSMKVQHIQVQQDRRKPLTEFRKESEVNLKYGEQYNLISMADTSDNKLLLCNYKSSHPKVYKCIYKDYKTYEEEISFTSSPYCITVVPCTDKAVVTLPGEKSIQFINTTNNTKEEKIKIREWCYGVTAVKDKIYIGGNRIVLILNTDGSRVRKITTDGFNYNLLYNERNGQLLLRHDGRLCCINLDGHVIYRYDISGNLGLAVDQQGHVYISGLDSNDIQRLSPDGTFRDIVLSKHDGIYEPRGITFNNDFTKLFIINGNETVLVYSCI
jgi:DNA-binding beta-propeller fold protein YncE